MQITNFIIINVVTILYNIINLFMFKYENKYSNDIEAQSEEEKAEADDGNNKKQQEYTEEKYKLTDSVGVVFLVFMFFMNIVLANVITYVYQNSVAINVKLMFIVSILWPIAFIDSRTKRIPTDILKIMLVGRLVFLIPEFIMVGDISHRLLSMLIATVAVFLACVLCCLLIKGAIGMGDVKLFSVMALYLGLEGIWPAIFCSLIVSFFVAVFSLVTKRAKRKDNIPFAPAILIGTYLSVFLTGI